VGSPDFKPQYYQQIKKERENKKTNHWGTIFTNPVSDEELTSRTCRYQSLVVTQQTTPTRRTVKMFEWPAYQRRYPGGKCTVPRAVATCPLSGGVGGDVEELRSLLGGDGMTL
jgi:hypothetical protein